VSQNLVELIRRHHAVHAPTALDVLKAAVEDHGELTDDDRKRAAEVSGLPEASVYGVSRFYDDLLAPQGARHVRVCTGTACLPRPAARTSMRSRSASASGWVSVRPTGRRRWPRRCVWASVTARLRSATATSSTPAPMRSPVCSTAARGRTPEPEWQSLLSEAVLTEPADWSGLRRALSELTPDELVEIVEEAKVRGRGGAGFPAGTKWRFTRAAKGEEKFIVANGDEGDPGSYIDKYLMEQRPIRVLEGLALAGYAVGAQHGFVLTRSEYPRSKPALDAAIEQAHADGWLGENILGSAFDFDMTIVEGAGSYVVGEETALLACLQGCAAPCRRARRFPRSAACTADRRSSTTSRRSATCRSSPSTARRPTLR
jgi:hypothetical protein